MTPNHLQDKAFLLLLIAVTIAFGAILWQFHGAVFWGVILAILFAPLHRKLLKRMPKRPTLAALCTLGLCLVIVILPMTAITVSLVQEASVIYERVRSGQLNFGLYLQQVIAALPAWAANLLDRLNLTSIGELQQKLSSVAVQASQFVATQALSIGQNTLEFLVGFGIMLYLLFFLLRDGASLARRIGHATPLDDAHKRQLVSKFTTVIRATVKGNIELLHSYFDTNYSQIIARGATVDERNTLLAAAQASGGQRHHRRLSGSPEPARARAWGHGFRAAWLRAA